MSICVIANENAKDEFSIPVTWEVFDKVKVQANSLKEAMDYVYDNLSEIPLGDDPTYADDSYHISEDGIDELLIYQGNDPVCIEFKCNENLSQFIDSMLFDSGTVIATGRFYYKNMIFDISLKVSGKVRVKYKDEVYKTPSEFPEELKTIIRSSRDWDALNSSEIFIDFRNWFEYVFDHVDGEVFEDDLSKVTPERILEDMSLIAHKELLTTAELEGDAIW